MACSSWLSVVHPRLYASVNGLNALHRHLVNQTSEILWCFVVTRLRLFREDTIHIKDEEGRSPE